MIWCSKFILNTLYMEYRSKNMFFFWNQHVKIYLICMLFFMNTYFVLNLLL